MSHLPPLTLEWFTSRPRAPFFCEENVWLLCRDAPWAPCMSAIVIANDHGSVAMWAQRAATVDPILWDYHVVVVVQDPTLGPVVVDSDCRDGPTLPLATWLLASFRSGVRDAFAPRFRVLNAADYVEILASDRRHMLTADGTPTQPFPPWPPPHPDRPPTLSRLIDPTDDIGGVVTDIAGLCHHFGHPLVSLPPLSFTDAP